MFARSKFALALFSLAVTSQASAQAPQQIAKLTASQVFFKQPKLDINALHPCQPLKGTKVAVFEVKKNLEGMKGLDLARVRVLEGTCADQEGWVGMERLEAANQ